MTQRYYQQSIHVLYNDGQASTLYCSHLHATELCGDANMEKSVLIA